MHMIKGKENGNRSKCTVQNNFNQQLKEMPIFKFGFMDKVKGLARYKRHMSLRGIGIWWGCWCR